MKRFICQALIMPVLLLKLLLKKNLWKKKVKQDMIMEEKNSSKKYGNIKKLTEMELKTNWEELVPVWIGTERFLQWINN